jgi:hypothetical protein
MMTRTIVSIERTQLRALRARARARGMSVAAIIRALVTESLADSAPRRKVPAAAFERIIGLGASGCADVSDRHDDRLGQAFRDESAR